MTLSFSWNIKYDEVKTIMIINDWESNQCKHWNLRYELRDKGQGSEICTYIYRDIHYWPPLKETNMSVNHCKTFKIVTLVREMWVHDYSMDYELFWVNKQLPYKQKVLEVTVQTPQSTTRNVNYNIGFIKNRVYTVCLI